MLRLLVISSFALVMDAALPRHTCEPDLATEQLLTRWRATASDARLGHDARMAPLWEAIVADPDNVFLHHAYQLPLLSYIGSVRVPGVAAAYNKLLQANPESLALRYASAHLLYGTRTADSRRILEEVTAADPDFPWPHLALARVYQNRNFADETRFREESERFFALCPGSLAPEAYEQYLLLPQALRSKIRDAVRQRLSGDVTPGQLRMFSQLWQFEFQIAGDRHNQVRAQIAADLARIRKAAGNDLSLLDVVLEGYGLVDDGDGSRWARDRISVVAPHSFEASRIAIQRWLSDRTRPTMEDSRERVEGYYRELLDATGDWIVKWPLAEAPWALRLRAVRELPVSSSEQVLEVGEGLLRASAANSSAWSVAPSMTVAELYADRNVGWDRIPSLIERDRRDSRERLASDRLLDSGPATLRQANELNAAESRMQAHVLAIRRHMRMGEGQQATAELRQAESEAASASDDNLIWRLQPRLVDACLALRDMTKARAALAPLERWLDSHAPAETADRSERLQYRNRQADYSERAAASRFTSACFNPDGPGKPWRHALPRCRRPPFSGRRLAAPLTPGKDGGKSWLQRSCFRCNPGIASNAYSRSLPSRI